ncbi:YtpR family tRNA-binding protein [Marinilactibacillus sp. GCM10026970]|uniref:YtpR family tRNA-binding protein n=1 Tax=Marinilactibacillus sp. GCM10026970 TaxID=3252642 RepID=UPI00360707A3
MFITSYNNKGLNDVLMVQLSKCAIDNQKAERKGNVTKIVSIDQGETVGFNFFELSELFSIDTNGPVTLSNEQVSVLNKQIKQNGWEDELVADISPKFVVGYVKECVPMEDSDHLNITQTEVDNGEVVQIVCGASNIEQGQKVVVAKPGAIMPDGLVIWPGELRGTKSSGMICSAKELGLEQTSKGILVLEDTEETGRTFELTK